MSTPIQAHDQGLVRATRPSAKPWGRRTWAALVKTPVPHRYAPRLVLGALLSALVVVCAPALAAGPESEARTTAEAFQRHFERAFASGKQAEVLALFYWRGVPKATRDGVTLLVRRDLNATLRRSGWLPPEPAREFWSGNVRMRSNLKVIARFAAEFEIEGGERHLSVHEIGIVDGVLYIGLAEPVPLAQSVMLLPSGSTAPLRHARLPAMLIGQCLKAAHCRATATPQAERAACPVVAPSVLSTAASARNVPSSSAIC